MLQQKLQQRVLAGAEEGQSLKYRGQPWVGIRKGRPLLIKWLTIDPVVPFHLAPAWIYCYKVLNRGMDGVLRSIGLSTRDASGSHVCTWSRGHLILKGVTLGS